jgi:tetratricopeptide (TPR) repeat protein
MTKNVSSPAQRTIQQAWTAYNASKYAEALKLARAAKRSAGTLPEPYYIESLCLSGMNHSEEAKRLAEAGMKRFPNHPGFLGLVGALDVALENYAAGIPLLQRSLELQPGSAHLWQVLGTITAPAWPARKPPRCCRTTRWRWATTPRRCANRAAPSKPFRCSAAPARWTRCSA